MKPIIIELQGGIAYLAVDSADAEIIVRDYDIEHDEGDTDHKQDADGVWFWEYTV